MKSVLRGWQRRTDFFSILLGFFFLVLIALFLYLARIDKDIEHYDAYHYQLTKMRLLDYRFNTFFSRSYRFIDYDETVRLERDFEKSVSFLKTRDIQREFGKNIYARIEEVEELYTIKKEALEDFKALNARVTHSIYFLFDLMKKMEETVLRKDEKKRRLADDIFFTVSQILMDLPYDKSLFRQRLSQLEKFDDIDKKLYAFVRHGKQFLKDTEEIGKIKQKVSQIPLQKHLNGILKTLQEQYRQNRYWQKLIAFSLFLFAFVILSLLIVSYRRIRTNTRELQAFRYAIENSDNAIVLTNPKREIVYVNEAFEKRSGYTKEEVLGENPNILKSDLLSESFYKELNETLERGEIWQGELINRRKDGSLLYEKASIIPIYIDGELVQYLAVKLDITEYKEQQIRLKQAAAVYEMIGDGILVTDKEKRILAVNPAFEKMFGYTEEELVGKEPMLVRTLKEDAYFYRQMWDTLLANDRWAGKIHNQTKDGTVLPIWLTLTIVRDEHGEIENFIAIYTNLQEIIETQERAEYLAYHDSLTGLPNRAYFDLRINDILSVAKTQKQQVAVLFLDLDRFKVINDTLGHSVGDAMLVELAKRMHSLFREDVLFARMGGDEFVVTCIVKHGKDEVAAMAEKILATIREPIFVYDYYLNTTASIGIALFPDDGQEKYQIVKYADSAMYAAKEKGKDTYHFYNKQLSLDVQTRLGLEQELLHAIEEEELYLHFQPQYDLQTKRTVGAEVLLRWHSKVLGDVSPERFISIAEETGVIIKIGYYLFEEACKAFKRWERDGCAPERIAVNISAVQFRDDRFLETIEDILKRTEMAAEVIEIEITERFIMEYSKANMTILEDLRDIGCRISIDDFGTGYSSLSYMKRLPLDAIKIDRSFVTDLPENTHDTEVTRAIIALSKSLGYQVVAEGIENEDQEAFLLESGCDIGQGYYYAKPMDEEAFVAFLKEKNI